MWASINVNRPQMVISSNFTFTSFLRDNVSLNKADSGSLLEEQKITFEFMSSLEVIGNFSPAGKGKNLEENASLKSRKLLHLKIWKKYNSAKNRKFVPLKGHYKPQKYNNYIRIKFHSSCHKTIFKVSMYYAKSVPLGFVLSFTCFTPNCPFCHSALFAGWNDWSLI